MILQTRLLCTDAPIHDTITYTKMNTTRITGSRVRIFFNDYTRHSSPARMFACSIVVGTVSDANSDFNWPSWHVLANAYNLTMTTCTQLIVIFVVDVHDSFYSVGERAFVSIESEVPFSAARCPRAIYTHSGSVRHFERRVARFFCYTARLLYDKYLEKCLVPESNARIP